MNNYKELFYKIKKSNLGDLSIESNFSKRIKDEFLILRSSQSNQNYDIHIQIWKKLFSNCSILQVSGHYDNQHFKVFFKLDGNDIKLFNFADRESCRDLYDKKHKFLEHRDDNLKERKRIYRDTKKLLEKFNKILSK